MKQKKVAPASDIDVERNTEAELRARLQESDRMIGLLVERRKELKELHRKRGKDQAGKDAGAELLARFKQCEISISVLERRNAILRQQIDPSYVPVYRYPLRNVL